MKKNVFAAVAALLLLCGLVLPGAASAEDRVDGEYTYTVTDGAAAITRYIGPGGAVTVPETLGGYPVTAIGSLAFTQTDITSVVIPAGISAIGGAAFEGCDYLTEAVLPEGLTEVPDSLFYYCEKLKRVTIPDSVTRIGESAFDHCKSLTDAALPDSVTDIGDDAFIFCSALTEVTLPEDLQTLGSYAFGFCTGLRRLTLPEGMTALGSCALIGCTGLTALTLPSTLRSIGASAFLGCTGLRRISIPDGVTSIASGLFSGCTALTEITLPDTLREVAGYAFDDTPWLQNYSGDFVLVGTSLYRYQGTDTQVTVPDGVSAICAGAFEGNDRVKGVTIPSGVRSIGHGAFAGCTSLANIVIPDTVTDTSVYAFARTPWLLDRTGLVTAGKVLISYTGGDTAVTVPAGVTAIGDAAFSQRGALESVTIPSAVTYIGEGNFTTFVGGGDGAFGTEPMDLTLLGDTGSFAQCYAQDNGIAFKNLGSLRGVPTTAKLFVDGTLVSLEAYNIDGHNFFKLRDVAAALSGTAGQFNVDWNAQTRQVSLLTKLVYEPVGGELQAGAGTAQDVTASVFPVYADGAKARLTAYLIHDNNFVMLRDLLRLLNVSVTWDAAANTVSIDTAKPYTEG